MSKDNAAQVMQDNQKLTQGNQQIKAQNIKPNQEIQKMLREVKQLEQSLNESGPGWLERISKIIKWPFSAVLGIGGGSATSAAVMVYSEGLMLPAEIAIGTLSAPALGGAFLGSVVTIYFASKGMDWIAQKWHESHLKALKEKSTEVIKKKIALLSKDNLLEPIDFEFNVTLSPNSFAAKHAQPLQMTEEYCNSLGEIFALRKKTLFLQKIDISDAGMTDEQLKVLISTGMGHIGTQSLILRNNKLSIDAITYLHQKIVLEKEAFQDLKILDLSGNQLTGESLGLVEEIADHVGLLSLNLSNNPLAEKLPSDEVGQTKLDAFLQFKVNHLYDLQELVLRKIGLSNRHEQSLRELLLGLNNLQRLDLRENPQLGFVILNDSLIKKCLQENISLRDIKTDHDKKIVIREYKDEMDKNFMAMGYEATSSQSRVLFLLQALLKGVNIPESIKRVLERSAFLQKALKSVRKKHAANDSTYSESEMVETLKRKLRKSAKSQQQDDVPSTPILNQYPTQKDTDLVRVHSKLLNDFGNGLMMFLLKTQVIVLNTKVNTKMLFELSTFIAKFKEKNENSYVFPFQGSKGERVAFVRYENGESFGFEKEISREGKSLFEAIDLETLPDAVIQINTKVWTTSLEELVRMPEEKSQPLEPATKLAN